jgi:two-component SAPR family response regulator
MTREQLADRFAESSDALTKALKALNKIFSLACFMSEETVYMLKGQKIIWVDAAACLELLEQARQEEQQGGDLLSLFQQAVAYFDRGGFLEEIEELWASGKRATLAQLRQHCLFRLTDLYEQRAMFWEAERHLARVLEVDPTDEEILCRLLLLLVHQEKFTDVFTNQEGDNDTSNS